MTNNNEENKNHVNKIVENIEPAIQDLKALAKNKLSEHGKLDSIASNLNIHQHEHIETGDPQDSFVVYGHEHIKTQNELNDIDSMGIVQSVGHLLRKARIMRNMSVEDVSRQLRLSVQQIEAIENENFEKLPGTTFLRGFIRNYANLVQLDPMPLLQLLPESTRIISTYERTPFKNKQLSFSSSRESSGNNSLVIIVILVLIVLGAYFVFENSGWNRNSDTDSMSSAVHSESGTASMEIQLPMSTSTANLPIITPKNNNEVNNQSNTAAELEVKTEDFPADAKLIAQSSDMKNAISKDSGNLYFKLSADSWVKVVDAKGVSLIEKLLKGGSEQIIVGKRPLSIVIGNTSGVILTYNDKKIDISSYKKQDGTARFTLE
ncbi:helix-turn-helix domain-containing protein [Nitrosomonas supralitoralis]|uniref:DUF4115 domain-containing protein n=1 Tax=Nitrosomonas supralitoralis TaxID=2116706 RepID=A0A2P7NV55_9PROT|nr:helix-turn-helix domain-containing protein [Nitrosomonas supralitoralis]PSJ17351.1 DUF4115 domain-containing protein [Nitrosomonas supralitoralis]